MNQEYAWEIFKKTGKICDYLAYKNNFLDKDVVLSQTNIFQGASDENKYKRGNS